MQEVLSPPRAATVVKDCAKACLQSTYHCLFENCIDMYGREFQPDETEASAGPHEAEPNLKGLSFWHKLIALIVSVIEEDQKSYGPVLNQ